MRKRLEIDQPERLKDGRHGKERVLPINGLQFLFVIDRSQILQPFRMLPDGFQDAFLASATAADQCQPDSGKLPGKRLNCSNQPFNILVRVKTAHIEQRMVV